MSPVALAFCSGILFKREKDASSTTSSLCYHGLASSPDSIMKHQHRKRFGHHFLRDKITQ
jgi:hypothetical protein